jgi:predicted O-methyltransferase YrrM
MDFINPLANEYCAQFSNSTPSFLRDMYEATLASHPHAHLQSSWTQGGFLAFLSQIMAPKRILEIGTFTGFSTLCLVEGLTSEGEMHTIELRAQDAQTAKNNFIKLAPNKNITLHQGDAKEILPPLNGPWDMVFIDADKTSYIDYYTIVLPQLNKNGIIIVDNVLFHGDVLQDTVTGKSAKAIQAFNEYVANDTSTQQVMLTVRDGLTLIRKK